MILKRWGKPPEKTEEVYYVDIWERGDGDIEIFLRDARGNRVSASQLFIIKNRTGHITLSEGIDRDIGFDLDEKGRLKINTRAGVS